MRFEVLAGNHNHYGKLFKKGEVVTTDMNLEKKFRGKFKRLHEEPIGPGKATATVPPPDSRGDDVTAQFPTVAGEGYLCFRRGSWYHVYEGNSPSPLNAKGLREGEVEGFAKHMIEGDDGILDPSDDDEVVVEGEKDSDTAHEPLGEDVTDQFPESDARGFTVQQVGTKFYVFDNEGESPISKALTKSKVDPFTKSFLEE